MSGCPLLPQSQRGAAPTTLEIAAGRRSHKLTLSRYSSDNAVPLLAFITKVFTAMYEFLQYRVRDAMTPSPLTTRSGTPLRELEAIFEQHDFNGIPMIDEEGNLLGMVTKFDLLKAFIFRPSSIIPHYDEIMEQPADGVMTREPVTVTPDLPLSRLLEKLIEMRIKCFPVVEGERLVGIIAREDVLKALRRATGRHQP